MKVIAPADKKISALWYPKCPDEKSVRWLTYILTEEVDDGYLIHNAVSGELLLLTQEEYYSVKIDENSELHRYLMEHRFLVQEDYCEEEAVQKLRRILCTLPASQTIKYYNILTTTYCNARCFYCYESDFPHIRMTDETTDQIIDFIEKHSDRKGFQISWFGGEPLMNTAVIDKISSALTEKGFIFTARMTSNGYLFTEELVKKAASQWKLKWIQITLDGTQDVYNKTKAYVNSDSNPYQRVLNNIGMLVKAGIRVEIRMNLNAENAENLMTLIDEIRTMFEGEQNLSMYCGIVMSDCGFKQFSYTEEDYRQIKEHADQINRIIAKYNLFPDRNPTQVLPVLKYSRCMASNPNSIQIAPDGTLSKCENFVFEHTIGNIKDGITNQSEVSAWKDYVIPEFCRNCPLIPHCIYPRFCPTVAVPCFLFERQDRIRSQQNNMKQTYMKWKKDQEANNETEV